MSDINEETYLIMKKIISDYEISLSNDKKLDVEEPVYITNYSMTQHVTYNRKYGDNRKCVCGHPYYRHFDSYEGMEPVGCKYCNGCYKFVECRSDKISRILK